MDVHTRFGPVHRFYLRYRRWLAAAAAAGCVLAAIHELAPPDPDTSVVVVAAHDLQAGQRLGSRDLRIAHVAADLVPAGAAISAEDVTGEHLTGPMRAGEMLTDTRILTPRLVEQYGSSLLATPVRLPDADVVALLQTGDRVAVFAATGIPGAVAEQLVSAALVIAVPGTDDRAGEGAVVVLALSQSETARVAQASATTQLSVSLR